MYLYIYSNLFVLIYTERGTVQNTSEKKNHFTIPLIAYSLEIFIDLLLVFHT